MIAVTSMRPPPDCAPEILLNQSLAMQSWAPVFNSVTNFGGSEPPLIVDMMKKAAEYADWSCLINADIVVAPKFRQVETLLVASNAKCAFSLRYQNGKVTDMGLDIFCAVSEVWHRAAREVPKQFRLGHILWDTWTLQFFAANYGKDCFDFTPSKVIFHTPHGNRKDQSTTKPEQDPYIDKFIWPSKTIKI
jgi:hypothetical protein